MEENCTGTFCNKVEELKNEIRDIISNAVISKGKHIEKNENGDLYKLDTTTPIFVKIDNRGTVNMEKVTYIKVQTYTTGKHTSINTPNNIGFHTEDDNYTELWEQNIKILASIADSLQGIM